MVTFSWQNTEQLPPFFLLAKLITDVYALLFFFFLSPASLFVNTSPPVSRKLHSLLQKVSQCHSEVTLLEGGHVPSFKHIQCVSAFFPPLSAITDSLSELRSSSYHQLKADEKRASKRGSRADSRSPPATVELKERRSGS